jgi:hypothetical protein
VNPKVGTLQSGSFGGSASVGKKDGSAEGTAVAMKE